MTVYVTGDIHSGLDMQKLRDWELGDSLASDDYLIVAGDFGFPWGFVCRGMRRYRLAGVAALHGAVR